jgi:hypothetical protein
MSATPQRAEKVAQADNKPGKIQGGKARDEEARLDEAIRDSYGKGPEDYTPEQWRGLREHHRLLLLYPGLWVAFREHWEGAGNHTRLVRVEVLCVSHSLRGLHRQMGKFPEKEQWTIMVTRVPTPDEPSYA